MNTHPNANQQQASQYPVSSPPDASALHGILRRAGEIRSNLHDIHGIADRACGSSALSTATVGGPSAVPNGMLEEIESALDGLMSLSANAVARLSRIA